MNIPRIRLAALLLVAAGTLSACADLPFRLPGERAAVLPPEKGLVVFKADAVGDKPVRRIQYSDNWQRVDYALFQGAGAQAEFIYMDRPMNDMIVFRFPFTIADKVATWNFSKGQPARFDEAVFIRTKIGYVFYRPYRLTAIDRQCFGVSGEWDRAQDDPDLKFTRILFGYYCAAPGQALANEKMLSLIDGIGIRGVTEPGAADPVSGFHADVEANFAGPQRTMQAIGEAQGAGDAGAGIAEFPFRYAERYQQSAKDDFIN